MHDTLTAVSVLLDAESCAQVSGTAEYKQWGKDDLTGSAKRVQTVLFSIDNIADTWSEKSTVSGEGRRYSKESGHEFVDNGEKIDYLPGVSNLPVLVKMLKPTRFDIWGRPGDDWQITGAEQIKHGLLVHLARETSSATAELFLDHTFSLPTRWTEIHPLGEGRAAKREVEIKALHVPDEWKRRVGMDMSLQGELGISSMVKDR